MAATYPLRLTAWNDLLGRINYLAAHPPTGCNPVVPLSMVSTPHKWSDQDIAAAQDKLKEICPDNNFTVAFPGGKWRERYIDELNAAIDRGWCNCLPCCIPNGQGTVWINSEYGGYYVTTSYYSIIDQYLRGYVDYGDAAAALPNGLMAHLVACYPGSGVFVPHSIRHYHWTNCIWQDYWDDGGKRGNEWWETCSQTEVEETDLGRLPVIAPNYGGSTSVGDNVYYDGPLFCSSWRYDNWADKWYQSCLIGYFEVNASSYVIDLNPLRC